LISPQEVAEWRHRGLYFKCGGSFHPRHQCPDRQLKVVVTEEGETVEEETEENDEVYLQDGGSVKIPFKKMF